MYMGSVPQMKADNGELFLSCCFVTQPCGCKITGDGSLQAPLDIERCSQHATEGARAEPEGA